MARIGVEQSLTDVKEALMEKGYEVVDLKTNDDVAHCDCCVITGQDENVMGMQTTSTAGAVIDARGYNAEDICQMVEQKLNEME
ncbi:YkuS family protein [Lentibacillus sp. L22]|uniref:YkuS family protein n=1 Tax=Lentibacillus TaxID=175304 RepID=UPI0022B09333|nr:YkuS family protein [Lentibacillus daqui]